MSPGRQRWIKAENREGSRPDVDAFLSDIVAVSRKHGLCLGHEDGGGAFEVHELDDDLIRWLMDALDARFPTPAEDADYCPVCHTTRPHRYLGEPIDPVDWHRLADPARAKRGEEN